MTGAHREIAPGTKWVYKDTDANLLGLVLAAATELGRHVAAIPRHLIPLATTSLDYDKIHIVLPIVR